MQPGPGRSGDRELAERHWAVLGPTVGLKEALPLIPQRFGPTFIKGWLAKEHSAILVCPPRILDLRFWIVSKHLAISLLPSEIFKFSKSVTFLTIFLLRCAAYPKG